MSCSYCRFWINDEYRYWSGEEVNGECRRYPKTVITPSDHWCGEISLNDIGIIRRSKNDVMYYCNEYSRERKKRIALEKKLKELRKKLKTGIKNENSTDQ